MTTLKITVDISDAVRRQTEQLAERPLPNLTNLVQLGEYTFVEAPRPGDFLQLEAPKGSSKIFNFKADSYWHTSVGDGKQPTMCLHIKLDGQPSNEFLYALVLLGR